MDHNMVLCYEYSSRNRWWQQTNVPPPWAISMAMAVRRCNMKRIAQCIMTRASPEPTGRHHQATTRSHQGDNRLNNYETCTHFVGRFGGHRDAALL